MISHRLKVGLTGFALVAIAACGQSGQTPVSQSPVNVPPANPNAAGTSPESTEQPSAKSQPPVAQPTPAQSPGATPVAGLAAGSYCYELKSKTLSAQAKVIVANQTVTGNFNGTVHNQAAGYFTSYQQTFQGPLSGNQANVGIQTKIEYDNQTSQETWTITPDTLKTERNTLQAMDCAKFGQISTKPDVPAEPPSRSQPQNERIRFAKGATSTVVKNAVVRAERNTYLLNAAKGQTMNIGITAIEDNAVFQVISPDGTVLAADAKSMRETLPTSGDYQISVGGTRGNATYEMKIEVK